MAGKVLFASEDLFFRSRIEEVSTALQLPTVYSTKRAELELVINGAEPPTLIILDLNSGAHYPIETIRKLKLNPATRGIQIVGYLQHTQQSLIDDAQRVGCDLVLSRADFSKRLLSFLKNGNIS
ncbi:MAG: response regulator [Candidatus Aenigmarchaeota archaeon]|nr:response regulator [Candidatus Aenigmarchaeota archaeon]